MILEGGLAGCRGIEALTASDSGTIKFRFLGSLLLRVGGKDGGFAGCAAWAVTVDCCTMGVLCLTGLGMSDFTSSIFLRGSRLLRTLGSSPCFFRGSFLK